MRACSAFLDLRYAITTSHVFLKIVQICPFFGLNYNSVAHKLRILEIEVIFDSKNPFFNNSMDDRIKTKAEITIFEMRYYMYILKLHMHLRVATIKKASWARLRVSRDFGLQIKIGSKSCFDK